MDLKQEIEQWDGKNKQAILATFNHHHESAGFLSALTSLLSHKSTERGSSWLLKHHFDNDGPPLTKAHETEIRASLPQLDHWEAKLHILQILPHLSIPTVGEETLEAFLNEGIKAKKNLVRAWSYYGLALFAAQFPQKRDGIASLLKERSEAETGGSVRVRIHKALRMLKTIEPAQ